MPSRALPCRLLSILFSVFILIFSVSSFAQEEGGGVSKFSGSAMSADDGIAEGSVWGLSYFNLTTADMKYVNRGGASWYMYQYLAFNYKFAADQRFAIKPTFSTETPGVYDDRGNTKKMKFDLGDLHVTYSNYNLANFPNEFDLSGTFYLYLPTSESSQKKKWVTRIRSWLILTRVIDQNWTIRYNAKPEYFFQTQKSFRNETTKTAADGSEFTSVRAENNKIGELDHYLEFSRYFNETFRPQFTVGFVHEWYHPSEEANYKDSLSEKLKLGLNTWIEVNRKLRFLVGVDNEVEIRRPQGDFELFQEKDNGYFVMTFWTID